MQRELMSVASYPVNGKLSPVKEEILPPRKVTCKPRGSQSNPVEQKEDGVGRACKENKAPLQKLILEIFDKSQSDILDVKELTQEIYTYPGVKYKNIESCYGSVQACCTNLRNKEKLVHVGQSKYSLK